MTDIGVLFVVTTINIYGFSVLKVILKWRKVTYVYQSFIRYINTVFTREFVFLYNRENNVLQATIKIGISSDGIA